MVLRKVLRLGASRAITLPDEGADFLKTAEYVEVVPYEGALVVFPAEVKVPKERVTPAFDRLWKELRLKKCSHCRQSKYPIVGLYRGERVCTACSSKLQHVRDFEWLPGGREKFERWLAGEEV